MAGNHLLLMLVGLLTGERDAAKTALTAARFVFDEYAFPAKIAVRPDIVAWPTTYDYELVRLM
jgi:hypothetical protein